MKSSKKYPNLSIKERLTDEEYAFWCDKQRTYPFYKLPRVPFEYINNGTYTQSDEVKINRAFWRFYRTLELGDVEFKDSGLNTTLELIIQAVTKSVEGAIKKEFGNRSKDTEENQEPKPTQKTVTQANDECEVNQETGEVVQTEQNEQIARPEANQTCNNPKPTIKEVDEPSEDDILEVWNYIISVFKNDGRDVFVKIADELKAGNMEVSRDGSKFIITATVHGMHTYSAFLDSKYRDCIKRGFEDYLPGHTFEFRCNLSTPQYGNGIGYTDPGLIDDLP